MKKYKLDFEDTAVGMSLFLILVLIIAGGYRLSQMDFPTPKAPEVKIELLTMAQILLIGAFVELIACCVLVATLVFNSVGNVINKYLKKKGKEMRTWES